MSTLVVPSSTSPRDDATQLNRAFKGIGCETGVIVNILAHRNATQRDNIQQEFETMYSYELKKELSSQLHGHLKKAVLLWMQNSLDRHITTLRQALTGPIIELKAANEIICSRTSSQIRQIKQAYASTHGTYLDYDIQSHTTGNHKELLLAYLNVSRYQGPEIDRVLVENDCNAMHNKLGEKKFGIDDKTLIQIFSERSRSHLVALSSTYQKLYGKELRTAIKEGTRRSFKHALLTILQCAHNPAKYFAMVLRKAMKGLGTKDTTLIRIVVTRAEVDMQNIKEEYWKQYRKSLIDAVHSETSGHYRTFLLSLLGSNEC